MKSLKHIVTFKDDLGLFIIKKWSCILDDQSEYYTLTGNQACVCGSCICMHPNQ
jgi:hypothetical protein